MNLHRREFLAMVGAGVLSAQEKAQDKKSDDVAVATATQDTTPRVSIVLSSFKEGEDHDGTKIAGLPSPRPVDADLDDAFINAWVRKAIEIGAPRAGDLSKIVATDDWVVIKTDISTCYGQKTGQPYMPGSVTDLRLVKAVIEYLVSNKCGARITVAEGSGQWLPAAKSGSAVDGWTTDWGGAFGGLSYVKMVDEFSKRYRDVRFEIADLNTSETFEGPVAGRAAAKQNPSGRYSIGKAVQQCDKVISVAPLKTSAATGVALTLGNYLGIASAAKYGMPKDALFKLGSPAELVVDLFSYHPADYCILGGPFGLEGDGAEARPVRHNVLVAGTYAVSVDSVAATLMGFDPAKLPYLVLAEHRGEAWGVIDQDSIWMRGNSPEEARRAFARPSGWKT